MIRINYFFFIIILNFLFFMNLFADFSSNLSSVVFSSKTTENVCEQRDITKTNI